MTRRTKAASAVNDDVCPSGATTTIAAYKGFNKDLTCTPNGVKFQYEFGKTYTYDGPVVRCASGGFHSVEMPQDAFTYYPPCTSRYGDVEASGQIDKAENEDTKLASATITVKMELSLGELTRRAVAWVAAMAKKQGNGNYAAGNYGHASAAGNYGHASAAGDYGHASAAGDYGHASAAGNYGHASAAGTRGHASAAGTRGHASAAGDYGHASAAGTRGHASAAGDYGHASAAGYSGHASAAGYSGHASAAGDGGHASAAGDGGHASAAGNYGHAEVKGKNAIAHAAGCYGKATAGVGGAISLAAYDDSVYPPKLVVVRSSMVGENGIEPGKTYRLSIAGQFEEVEG